MVPALLSHDMADEIVLVQALHDDDDHALRLVVEARVQGAVKPLIGRLALNVGNGFVGLERIVDNDQIGAATGQDAVYRSRKTGAPPVVVSSCSAARGLIRRVGKRFLYQVDAMTVRQSRANLSDRAWP